MIKRNAAREIKNENHYMEKFISFDHDMKRRQDLFI